MVAHNGQLDGRASPPLVQTSKLIKPFQFIQGRPSRIDPSPDSDKENRSHGAPRSSPGPAPQTEQPDPLPSPQKPFPSTPATRLPLADLIGSAEDPDSVRISLQPTPEDQILWRTLRSPKAPSSKTPASRSTKRARSSSPPPSAVSSQKRHAADQYPADLNSLKHNSQTPHLDPAADIWHRYAVGTVNASANGFVFPNVPFPASPRAVDDAAGNVSGLRRWTSCGIEWPTSKAKRRKLRHETIKEQIDEAVNQDAPQEDAAPSGAPPTSKISSLIERIQQSLAQPREPPEEKGPSSSSPLPERNDSFERRSDASSSPTRHPNRQAPAALSSLVRPGDAPEHQNCEPTEIKQPASSAFDCDDLDVGAFDASLPKPGNTNTETALQDQQGASATLQQTPSDEFADDDLDIGAVDFEALISLENRTLPPVQHESATIDLQKEISAPPPGLTDEFGDEDLDEECFMAAEVAATQSLHASTSSGRNHDTGASTIQRYLINRVSESVYTAKNMQQLPEKVLVVEDEKTKLFKTITLRQSWFDTRCIPGCYVHVIGEFTKGGECLIDDAQNMLILHPDHLVSTTVIADSFGCMRRAVLQDRVKATNESSPPQLYGTILHEIFQEAIKANRWDTDWLKETIDMLIARHIESLYEVKLSIPQATEYLLSKMPELQSWAQIFVKAEPQDRNGKHVHMSIKKLLDVEEHVWSPMYGMKGNIDATVQVAMRDEQGSRTLTVPFEVKTGKNSTSTSHRAQTALYTLLLSDRYDVDVVYGILYYLETSEISRVPAIRHELRHMVMQRNELACFVREGLSLPPMLKNKHTCSRCYAKTPCFLYHKLIEGGTGETSGLRDKFDELVKHLKPVHQEFFRKWDDLLTKEESEMMKFKRELWTMLSIEREKLGRCFANVVLEPTAGDEEQSTSKINRFKYTFRKLRHVDDFSFSESHIAVGEPIVVSDEKGHYALAKGYVTSLQKRTVTVAVDRRLHNARTKRPGFDAKTNQTFSGIMQVDISPSGSIASQPEEDAQPMLYRLDKDEFSSGLATVRNNLVQLMTEDAFHSRELRNLVVADTEPRFKPTSSAYTLSGPQSQMCINDDQRAAIEKIMTAEDYALVLGMPGTGKTTTIAHIIRALVAKGKSVLLASYTHTAVDNILLKIRQHDMSVLRLGALAKIHPEVREFAVLAAEPKTSIEQLQREYHELQVVATTCLGVNHPIFNERVFDYCIVDEASQITLPVCLGPIRMAKAFILVGDHYQLPPLVQNREALQGGLDVSLFKLLSDRHPSAVVELQHQYRMNEAIMSLSSNLIYGGRLKCGSEEVARRMLELPSFDALAQIHNATSSADAGRCTSHESSSCWLNVALGPSSAPVVFLNTDTILPAAREAARGARITNAVEATLTTDIIRALLLAGLAPESIGTITLYRSQLALIKSVLQSTIPPSQLELLEAHTTDRFQGRDKDVVILSCVRNNERDAVGDLLKDWRRVNVAMTRAKKKLIIIGSKGTLSRGDDLLRQLISLCEKERWLIDLPVSARDPDVHSWPTLVVSTAASRNSGVGESGCDSVAKPRPGYVDTQDPRKKLGQVSGSHLPPFRPPLRACSANAGESRGVQAAFKQPSKAGSCTAGAVLGAGRSSVRDKRPILADLVNDILGENMLES